MVKFKISHTLGSLYVPGDTAVFDEKVEKDLVDRKIADKVTDTKKPAA